MSDLAELRSRIETAFADRSTLAEHADAVREVIGRLDRGDVRIASKGDDGSWTTHACVGR